MNEINCRINITVIINYNICNIYYIVNTTVLLLFFDKLRPFCTATKTLVRRGVELKALI